MFNDYIPLTKRSRRGGVSGGNGSAIVDSPFADRAIIVDAGSYEIRAGWSHQTSPHARFRPLVGKLRGSDLKNLHGFVEPDENEDENTTTTTATIMSGRKRKRTTTLTTKSTSDESLSTQSLQQQPHIYSEFTRGSGGYVIGRDLHPGDYLKYNVRTSFDRDVIFNMTLQEHLFDYMFYRLGLSKSSSSESIGGVPHPIVMTECICNPNYARSQMNELLFEKYGVPSIGYGIDSQFSYYHYLNRQRNSDGHRNTMMKNGLIVRSGYHSTHIVPIFSINSEDSDRLMFQTDFSNVRRLSIGGYNVTDYLFKILQLKYPFTNTNLVTANQTTDLNVNTHLMGGITVQRAQEIKEKYCRVAMNYVEELNRLASDETFFNDETVVLFDNYDDWRLQRDYYESQLNNNNNNNSNTREESIKNDNEREQNAADSNSVKDQAAASDDASPAKRFGSKQEAEQWLRQMHLKLVNAVQELKTVSDALTVQDEQPAVDIKSKRTAATKQRKKAQLAAQIHEGDDETFGMDDDHWDLYNEMETPKASELDSKQRKALQRRRKELEGTVAQMTREIQVIEQDVFGHQRSTVPTFFLNQYQHGNIAKQNKANQQSIFYNALYATVERIRAPEIVFEPGMIGLHNPGILEMIQQVIAQYPVEKQKLLLSNVYLCGGNTHFPGFADRIRSDLRSITPFDWPTVQVHSEQSVTDAWCGAQQWYGSKDCDRKEAFLTREMYDELGSNRLQQHFLSNVFVTKPESPVESDSE